MRAEVSFYIWASGTSMFAEWVFSNQRWSLLSACDGFFRRSAYIILKLAGKKWIQKSLFQSFCMLQDLYIQNKMIMLTEDQTCGLLQIFFYQLLPLGVSTVNHLLSSHPDSSILVWRNHISISIGMLMKVTAVKITRGFHVLLCGFLFELWFQMLYIVAITK